MASTGDNSLLATEKTLIDALNEALTREESFLLQKSRVKWMGLGDGNNSFFHQQCKVNWNYNKILTLEDDNGNLAYGQAPCANIAVNFFHNLLGPSVASNPVEISLVSCKVLGADQARELEASVNDLLIFETIRKMKKNKAPDPDGVNV